MNKAVKLRCDECGDVIFTGYEYEYEYPPDSGNLKQDIDGKYSAGAGRCRECGRELCEHCGGFVNGVCKECGKEDGE
jgi:hypothetical protein